MTARAAAGTATSTTSSPPSTATGPAVCDDCFADLNPAITVTVQFFSARSFGSREPFAVIRQRTRSDYPYPDGGQQMTWRLCWEHARVHDRAERPAG
jgi:hypothetical protein